MQTLENKVVSRETIFLDDKHFVNCSFTECTLVYAGGDVAFSGTTSITDCQFALTGPADRTAIFMGTFGMNPASRIAPKQTPVVRVGGKTKSGGAIN